MHIGQRIQSGEVLWAFPSTMSGRCNSQICFAFPAADTFGLVNFDAYCSMLPKFAYAGAAAHSEVFYGSAETAEFMTLIM